MKQMYGGFINRLMEDMKGTPAPQVGMGATRILYSDRCAYTITSVAKSGKSFTMKRDIAIRKDDNGQSDSQAYEYLQDPTAPQEKVRLGKYGWRTQGSKQKVVVGLRDEYYDYTF